MDLDFLLSVHVYSIYDMFAVDILRCFFLMLHVFCIFFTGIMNIYLRISIQKGVSRIPSQL